MYIDFKNGIAAPFLEAVLIFFTSTYVQMSALFRSQQHNPTYLGIFFCVHKFGGGIPVANFLHFLLRTFTQPSPSSDSALDVPKYPPRLQKCLEKRFTNNL
jgi:hypothetical protein